MAGNSIYRGPTRKQAETVNLPVAGAYLPGLLVTSNAVTLTQAVVADSDNELLVLANVEFNNQPVSLAYVSGDTGVAYKAVPGETYQVRVAAGTYAVGDPMTVNASGQLAAAATTNAVIAYCQQAGTFSAADLADVIIANRVKLT